MTHTYNMIGYAKQLQNDLKEFNGVDVALDEIIKEHDLEPTKLYVTDNELVLLEVLENEKKYKIEIVETLSRVVEVKAKNYDEAFEKVRKDYYDEVYILDSYDYIDTDFTLYEE